MSSHPENISLTAPEMCLHFRRAIKKLHEGRVDELTVEEHAAVRMVAESITEEDPS